MAGLVVYLLFDLKSLDRTRSHRGVDGSHRVGTPKMGFCSLEEVNKSQLPKIL
jgi:hypothetical protein